MAVVIVGVVVGVLGFVLSNMMQPQEEAPGQTATEMQIPSAREGVVGNEVLGTVKTSGNLMWYGNNRNEEQKQESSGGKGGGGSQEVTTGYKYYLTWAQGICLGPVDKLLAVYRGDDCVWSGSLSRPGSGGEETITLQDMGNMTIYFGTDDQAINTTMSAYSGSTITPAYRHLAYAFFNDCFIGTANRMPRMNFVVQKAPTQSFGLDGSRSIDTYDYNGAHAIWHILETNIGLDTTYLHSTSFYNAGITLAAENRGISVLMSRQQDGFTYIESILNHIDGVLRWGNDAKLHLKLLRQDAAVSTLPVVTEKMMLDEMQLDRLSWLETHNEIKVQYNKRFSRDTTFDEYTPPDIINFRNHRWRSLVSYPHYAAHHEWIPYSSGGYNGMELFHNNDLSPTCDTTSLGCCYMYKTYLRAWLIDKKIKYRIRFWAQSDSPTLETVVGRIRRGIFNRAMDMKFPQGSDQQVDFCSQFMVQYYTGSGTPTLEETVVLEDYIDPDCMGGWGANAYVNIFFDSINAHSNQQRVFFDYVRILDANDEVVDEWDFTGDVVVERGMSCQNEGAFHSSVEAYGYLQSVQASSVTIRGLDFKDAEVVARDVANQRIVNRVSHRTAQMKLFTKEGNASWSADRILLQGAYPYAQISFPANREVFRLETGDPFVLNYAPYSLSGHVYRVSRIDEAGPESEEIKVSAGLDVRYLGSELSLDAMVDHSLGTDWNLLEALDYVTVIELPYVQAEEKLIVAPIAARKVGLETEFQSHLSLDQLSYNILGTSRSFAVHGLLAENYPIDTFRIDDDRGILVDFDSGHSDVSFIESKGRADLLAGIHIGLLEDDNGNQEIISFQTITPVSGNRYRLSGIFRGRFDTEPLAFAKWDPTYEGAETGTHFYWLDQGNWAEYQNAQFTVGSTRYFKLVPHNLKQSGVLEYATMWGLAITGRSKIPYRPINLTAEDEGDPGVYQGIRPTYSSQDITLRWSPRVRGTGSGHGDPSVVTDAAVTWEGYFEVEVWVSDVLMRTATAINAASWTYTEEMNIADNGSAASSIVFKLSNYIDNADGNRYQSAQTTITVTEL